MIFEIFDFVDEPHCSDQSVDPSPYRWHKNRGLRFGLCLLLVLGAGVFFIRWFLEPSPEQLLTEARRAVLQGDYARARNLSVRLLKQVPNSPEASLLHAQAAFALGYCTEAENAFRNVLKEEPENQAAHWGLVRLLKVEGRYWELRPHALALFQLGDSGGEFLLPLAAPDALQLSEEELRQANLCRVTVPDDALPLLGLAKFLRRQNEDEEAKSILKKIISGRPEQIEAQAQLGSLLLEAGETQAFLNWHRRLPKAADMHPEIWFLWGQFALTHQERSAARRCFWETLRRDPNHRRANYQLSQILTGTGQTSLAKRLALRSEQLEEISRLATKGDDSSTNALSAKAIERIAQLMEELGRLREAVAWHQFALQYDPNIRTAASRIEVLERRIDRDTPLTLASHQAARQMDFSDDPLPDWTAFDESRPPAESMRDSSAVTFVDVAEAAGLKFTYQNGADPRSGLARMFEFSGGGVAILDYDGDGWPDVYLTQGCPWPPGSGETRYQDRLFRNIAGERFHDVTAQAGLGDENYSQGAAVGDFNNDGCPDLYVANIGANRLYLNNGDGTFEDVTNRTGTAGEEWTVSGLIADLNNDGLPDIYSVNYLGGTEIFTRRCEQNGRPIQCPLHYFPSAQDRLYLNQGDGRFRDATESAGIVLPDGKGMGIVAGRFNETAGLSLFIANDDTPNFYFVPNPDNQMASLSFLERGVISGLAYGDLGLAQSSMGVAAGDANGDGLLDFYVTNFTNEHNNLYIQEPAGSFTDKAREAGLHLPTLQKMGWGAQFLDGESDGRLDLVVANGHLDENTSGNYPYEMPAQYFRNLGKGRFLEMPANQLGAYFERPHAGRAVARLDWNRDGLEDCCITHVDAPVALLSNQTPHPGHYLVLHLRGVRSSRDAIGSIVKIKTGSRTLTRYLTAGDGFEASNQRILTFGLGPLEHVDEVEIHWPGETRQKLGSLKPNTEILIVEGQPPRFLPRAHPPLRTR